MYRIASSLRIAMVLLDTAGGQLYQYYLLRPVCHRPAFDLSAVNTIGVHNVSMTIADVACAKFESVYGRKIIFSDACVSNEIRQHVVAYLYAISERSKPNFLSILSMINDRDSSRDGVFDHAYVIDIYEGDVRNWKQALMFDYQNGIRYEYWYTELDPYASLRPIWEG